ncbi:hypothetical protein CC78DRAFT_535693 [Lojkania enalia]|uniref:Uncharacterized protein n=1 Tax=Lojkania enalia TaxID=147567 RepID=A0A9P4K1V3_9PLEO|nr:hypothetical protein CC78DRAFT_535693 [Didymosphaeria enalia]
MLQYGAPGRPPADSHFAPDTKQPYYGQSHSQGVELGSSSALGPTSTGLRDVSSSSSYREERGRIVWRYCAKVSILLNMERC